MDRTTPKPWQCARLAALTLVIAALVACAAAPAPSPLPQPPTPVLPTTIAPSTPTADHGTALPRDFARWVTGFRAVASAAGIGEPTLQSAFHDIRYLPRVVELDRAQPEFTRAVWDYLDTAVSPQRIARGRDKMLEIGSHADAAAARYGVPAGILLAIWGMESNYGTNYGDIPTIDALATLGFDGRREDWARGQLIAALRILQDGDISRARMVGSWAGAMGQTQFLPTNFLAYAVDGDGDGRRDLWGSMADVMASTAHFLARSGWQAGQAWGLEVQLPAGFDPARADPALRQSSALWAVEGLRAMGGGTLLELADAELLLPTGARGPAFLVGPNFRAILRYNNATSYALGVGLLAQQLTGGPGVQASWPRDLVPLTRSQLQALQSALNQRGHASGMPDGIMGPATRAAIRQYQRSIGAPADGYPYLDLLLRLQSP